MHHKSNSLFVALFAGAALLAGCGSEAPIDDDDSGSSGSSSETSGGSNESGGSFDNVSACNNWVNTVNCGNVDVGMFVNCETYSATACDIADYFDCLSSNTSCNAGTLDQSGWTQCVEMAQCN